ncbi:MAG TPA: hypothetical protein VF582_02220 [Allosphingosinicella sp.]
MLSAAPIILPAAATDEAKAYLRIVGSDEDTMVARLMRGAAELCEQFTGQVLIARSFTELLPVSPAWARLSATPVKAISGVEVLPAEGAAVPLAGGDFAIDIDANGDGWVRITNGAAKRARVTFEAGMASQWNGVPESLRQGIVRLAAHLYARREAADGAGPPAAVTALWRPWRRIRLGATSAAVRTLPYSVWGRI